MTGRTSAIGELNGGNEERGAPEVVWLDLMGEKDRSTTSWKQTRDSMRVPEVVGGCSKIRVSNISPCHRMSTALNTWIRKWDDYAKEHEPRIAENRSWGATGAIENHLPYAFSTMPNIHWRRETLEYDDRCLFHFNATFGLFISTI